MKPKWLPPTAGRGATNIGASYDKSAFTPEASKLYDLHAPERVCIANVRGLRCTYSPEHANTQLCSRHHNWNLVAKLPERIQCEHLVDHKRGRVLELRRCLVKVRADRADLRCRVCQRVSCGMHTSALGEKRYSLCRDCAGKR